MWVGAIWAAFAAIRSPELLLPMSLSKGCESPETEPADAPQMILLCRIVKFEFN
jgi:hypothetical protein